MKVYTQTIITFRKSNNLVSKGQQIHSYLYIHNKYSKHNINQFKNNFISQYAICMKINIHSQKNDHRWSLGAISPGFAWSSKSIQKQIKLIQLNNIRNFQNSEPEIQTNFHQPSISTNNSKIPWITQNSNFGFRIVKSRKYP